MGSWVGAGVGVGSQGWRCAGAMDQGTPPPRGSHRLGPQESLQRQAQQVPAGQGVVVAPPLHAPVLPGGVHDYAPEAGPSCAEARGRVIGAMPLAGRGVRPWSGPQGGMQLGWHAGGPRAGVCHPRYPLPLTHPVAGAPAP